MEKIFNLVKRITVLSDIHNNFPSFEACIKKIKLIYLRVRFCEPIAYPRKLKLSPVCNFIEELKIQDFIFLGDYNSDMSFPQKTMQLLYYVKKNIIVFL